MRAIIWSKFFKQLIFKSVFALGLSALSPLFAQAGCDDLATGYSEDSSKWLRNEDLVQHAAEKLGPRNLRLTRVWESILDLQKTLPDIGTMAGIEVVDRFGRLSNSGHGWVDTRGRLAYRLDLSGGFFTFETGGNRFMPIMLRLTFKTKNNNPGDSWVLNTGVFEFEGLDRFILADFEPIGLSVNIQHRVVNLEEARATLSGMNIHQANKIDKAASVQVVADGQVHGAAENQVIFINYSRFLYGANPVSVGLVGQRWAGNDYERAPPEWFDGFNADIRVAIKYTDAMYFKVLEALGKNEGTGWRQAATDPYWALKIIGGDVVIDGSSQVVRDGTIARGTKLSDALAIYFPLDAESIKAAALIGGQH